MYFIFTRMLGESYGRRIGSLLLCLCDVFRALLIVSSPCVPEAHPATNMLLFSEDFFFFPLSFSFKLLLFDQIDRQLLSGTECHIHLVSEYCSLLQ